MVSPAHFRTSNTVDGTTYQCLICPNARITKDHERHSRRPEHRLQAAARFLRTNTTRATDEELANNAATKRQTPEVHMEEESAPGGHEAARIESRWAEMLTQLNNITAPAAIIPRETLPKALSRLDAIEEEAGFNPDDSAGLPINDENLSQPLDDAGEDEWEDIDNDEHEHKHKHKHKHEPTNSDPAGKGDWYPFKNKLDLVASLLIGHTRSMLSRTLYNKIREILTICDLRLPGWATVRASWIQIRKLLQTTIKKLTSMFDTPCFSLSAKTLISQDLANPLVSPHLDYYPEWSDGMDITKFSQSLKYSSPHRAQMCVANKIHFYIFERVQLVSKDVVIPLFIYKFHNKLFAKCLKIQEHHILPGEELSHITIPANIAFDDSQLISVDVEEFDQLYSNIYMGDGRLLTEVCGNEIYESNGCYESPIPLPNPWRTIADGKVLRSVPITLYADDTSGNTSKQFNKHISFYFTLSGLPPHLSNQEYNCHFLSTSNLATALEISEQIVEELNEMATCGYEAYDTFLGQPVWVATIVLCFLADSPMHAEITNTPNPGQSLNPCRICTLSCKQKKMKSTCGYVQKFLERDDIGEEMINALRSWEGTRDDAYELFSIATGINITQFKKLSLACGVKDAINT
ncbi:hypothetical protein PSTG_11997 [Puccinia striiformis f. sp. tritici PST-78]|uniref:Uncharacterized protein n=1 Tax=Puccinia striiformis f. sp. tritici PST-78 TaxID=1165861 RepID=A0A0L0V6L9_9BASI|nr:hypothetical protein PSTG_11997 [Puccinia striiformis f. sp. tritici PST-78]